MDNIFHDVAPLLNPLAFFRALGRGAHDAFTQPPIPMREAFGRSARQPRQQQGMPFDDGFMPPQAMQGMPVIQGMQGMPAMPPMPPISASVPLIPAAAPAQAPLAAPVAQEPSAPLRYGFNNGRYPVLDPAAPPLKISAEDWGRAHQSAPAPSSMALNQMMGKGEFPGDEPEPPGQLVDEPEAPAAWVTTKPREERMLVEKRPSELLPKQPGWEGFTNQAVYVPTFTNNGAVTDIDLPILMQRMGLSSKGENPMKTLPPGGNEGEFAASMGKSGMQLDPFTDEPLQGKSVPYRAGPGGAFSENPIYASVPAGSQPGFAGFTYHNFAAEGNNTPADSAPALTSGQMAAPVQQASPPAAAAAASPGGMSRREQIIQGLQDGSLDIDDEGNIHSVAQSAPAAAPGLDPGAVSAPPEPEAPFSQVPTGSQPVSAQGGMPAGYVPAPDAALDPYAEFRKRMLQNSLNADIFLQDQAEGLATRERRLNNQARYNNFWNNLSGAFGKGPSADVLKREQDQYQKSYDTLQNERQALMTSLVNRQNAVQNYMANTDPQAIANQVKMMKALADAQRVDYYGKDVDKRGQLGDRKADREDKKIDLQAERQKWQAEESQARKQQIENDIRVKNETLKDLVMTGQMKRADYEARIKKMEADAENDAKRLGFNYDKLRSDERLQAQKIESNEKIAGMNNSSREKVAADNNTAKMARTTTTQEYISDRQANRLVKGKPAATAEFINRMRVTPEKRQAYTKVMQHFANLTPEEQKAEAQKLKAYLKSNGMPIPAGL